MYDRGKGDFLRWLGKGDVFVDDTEENLKQAGELGFKTLTWPQPWNSSMQSSARTLAQLSNMAGYDD